MTDKIEVAYCAECRYPLHGTSCEMCENLTRESLRKRIILAGRMGGWKGLDNFKKENFKKSQYNISAFKVCSDFYSRSLTSKARNLFIHSEANGTGKTMLAVIALREYANMNLKINLIRPSMFFREVRACEGARDEIELLRSYAGLSALVLDDLDSAKDSEFAIQTLFDLIDMRYMNNASGLIVTANAGLDRLEKRWGGRIAGRLREMCAVFCLDGEKDHRAVQA